MEKTKFFVNRALQSDTVGNLDLSVRLAQSSMVLGKKNQVAGDVQPHLVSQRDTLMLCKPLNNSVAKGDSIEVLVYDKDNRLTYSSKDVSASNVPDIMGNISINANVVDSDFVEPSTYNYTISKQAELNKMQNDKTGAYLAGLLKQYNTIKIITSNGNWIPDFYLPNTLLTNQMITFHCSSGYRIRVYSNISSLSSYYTRGTKAIYRNIEIIPAKVFQWNLEGSVNYTHIYGYIISTQAELNKMKDDKTGAYLEDLLKQYNKIKIITSDGNWLPDFYLPNILVPNSKLDKVITFECNSGYGINIGRVIDGSYVEVKGYTTGQKTTYVNTNINTSPLSNGWVTLDDYKISQIGYMQDALACTLPYSCINPGMKLEFKYKDKKSTLNDIEIGGFSEVIINTIDIGLLTPNRNQFTIQKDYELQRQYFQSIPASRLIFNEYAPVHLTEVMLPNGTLLKTCDPSRANVYDGEMNASVAHMLFSFGINKANNGQNESAGNSISYSYFTPLLTTINSVGMYCSDGRVVHGLHAYIYGSANLMDSVGNEWSHEIGHCYGLGHYPNGANGSIHRPDGDINSSWGWDCNLNNFIPNFERNITNAESCYDDSKAIVFDIKSGNANDETEVMQCSCGCADDNENTSIETRVNICVPPFEGRKFNYDAMAGGVPVYSSYTLYTPYVLNRIQNFLESKAMFDRASSTGFSKWNATTKTMEPVNNTVKGESRNPLEQGVPVVTLLGYVDPSKKTAYIYPLLAGAYGMVYEALDTNSSGYYIQVKYNKLGKVYTLYYQLSSGNFSAGGHSNMFHINIKRDFEVAEYNVKVYLNNSLIQEKILNVPLGELKYYVHGKPVNA